MKKILMLILAVILVVAISVGATLAYLTDTEAVVNTFTVGKVDIDLTETGATSLDDINWEKSYTGIIPGQTYEKDPSVTVIANSEDCFVYVKVINGLSSIEAANNNIAAQIADNGWSVLPGVANVYYKQVAKSTTDTILPVFNTFSVSETAGNAEMAACEGEKIIVTAYAIQSENFADANAAWTAGSFA